MGFYKKNKKINLNAKIEETTEGMTRNKLTTINTININY